MTGFVWIELPVGRSTERRMAAVGWGGRRHRPPRCRGDRVPTTLHLGQHGIDGAGTHVAAQHAIEPVSLLLDHTHPLPQNLFAVFGDAVRTAALHSTSLVASRVDEAVAFQLRHGAVHAGTVDSTHLQLVRALGQAVAVLGLFDKQQQDRRQQEVARRGNLESRAAPACQSAIAASCSITLPPDSGIPTALLPEWDEFKHT